MEDQLVDIMAAIYPVLRKKNQTNLAYIQLQSVSP